MLKSKSLLIFEKVVDKLHNQQNRKLNTTEAEVVLEELYSKINQLPKDEQNYVLEQFEIINLINEISLHNA